MGSSFSLILSESISILAQSISKVFYLFILIFTISLFMKYCFYQRTDIWVFIILLIINLFLGGGIVYFFWYIFVHGTMGQYVPRALPLFPMLWTQTRMNNLDYLSKKEDCPTSKLPQIPEKVGGRYNSKDANLFMKMFYFWFQGNHTNDINLIAGSDHSVNPIIFGDLTNTNPDIKDKTYNADNVSPCDLSYNGIYTIDDWDMFSGKNLNIPN